MTDAVLIVGAGIAGLTAAQQIADAGAKAIVIERQAIIGGKLAAPLTKANAMGSRAEGESTPLLDALAGNENIEFLTNSNLEALEGRAGNFTATIRERARFVTDECTRCKLCHGVCPVVVPNEFDVGLTFRKAIYTPMIKTLPEAWVIDIDNCLNTPPNYLPCNRCIEVCDDNAIHFDQALDTIHERHVVSAILAPGMQIESGQGYEELGYGVHPDIVTSAEMQRLLESPGPSGGFATRPSNEEYPESVLLVLDDPSPFGLYIVASQAKQLLEQDIPKVSILVLSPPTSEDAASELTASTGINVHWGASFRPEANDDDISVSFEDLVEKRFLEERFEMIAICVDVSPPDSLPELAKAAGIDLGDTGYLAVQATNGFNVDSGKPGVFVAGCASGPKNIRDSIGEAKAAAESALAQLNPILLEGAETEGSQAPAADDDMRAQIEKLLFALIERA